MMMIVSIVKLDEKEVELNLTWNRAGFYAPVRTPSMSGDDGGWRKREKDTNEKEEEEATEKRHLN